MDNNIGSRGEKLKTLRLAKGLSLEEVYKKTKIHPSVLEALEQEKTLGMNPVYLRGFLRIYCNFLGIDSHEYLKGIKKPNTEYPVKTKEDVDSKPSLHLSMIKSHPKVIKAAAVVLVSALALFALFKMASNLKAYVNSKSKEKKIAQQRVAVKEEERPEVKPIAPSSDIRLGIHAKDDCWLKVKLDGKTVFERTLKKGQSETWEAKDKIELQIGKSSAIELDINGKILSPLGKKGQGIRRAVITKEGLEAIK